MNHRESCSAESPKSLTVKTEKDDTRRTANVDVISKLDSYAIAIIIWRAAPYVIPRTGQYHLVSHVAMKIAQSGSRNTTHRCESVRCRFP